nr:hypothetical protein [Tanacetum cinerariifolium]
MLGFTEWMELHSMASRAQIKANDQLLKNLKAKFQEEEFHLATTPQLIRIHNAIKKNSTKAKEMYNKLNFVIEARIDVVEARRNVLDNLDNLGQHTSASNEGLDEALQPQTYSSQRHHQGSRKLLGDILVSWNGYQL